VARPQSPARRVAIKAFFRMLWFVLPILVVLACAYLAIYMLVQLLWINR
jgi:hypothetical protein